MPPPTSISEFDPRFFRPCIFPVLRRLDYGVRPTVNNGVAAGSPLATDMAISLSLFDEDGTHLGTTGTLTELAPGEIEKFDLDELLERPAVRHAVDSGSDGDQLGVLHVVPRDLADRTSADVSTKAMMAHVFAS